MMNDPTNSATRAKLTRNVLKKVRLFAMSLCSSAVTSAPVSTSTPSGSTGAMRATSSSGDTPVSATTLMASTLPGAVRRVWAASRVKRLYEAPPGLSVPPKVAMPTTVTGCGPAWVSTLALSPMP